MAKTRTKRRREAGTGAVDQLPSGRYRARYRVDGAFHSAKGPDGRPVTFDTKQDAAAWLRAHLRGDHDNSHGVAGDPLFKAYAEQWLRDRTTKGRALKPRTRADYESLLERLITPTFGDKRMSTISAPMVRAWYAALDDSKPTLRARAYGLLRAVLASAVEDTALSTNPCQVKGAGHVEAAHTVATATLDELEIIVTALPPRYRAMALLAAWCGLRFGELAELRRKDVEQGAVRVSRGVVRAGGEVVVGDPKSTAGRRRVAIPPHLRPVLDQHLADHVPDDEDALLFPARGGGHMAPSALYRVWYPARKKAGREDLRFHDLRHTGATLAAQAGATLAELMARIGHSTPAAALKYQHAAEERDEAIAAALSDFAAAGAVSLKANAKAGRS